jgi:hypothetical protein
MKKYFLLFAAGGLLTLASCGGENKPAEAVINADSLAKVKVDSATNAMKAQEEATLAAATKAAEDSIAAATAKADSIAHAAKKTTTEHAKPAAKKVTAPKVVTPPAPTSQDAKFENRTSNNTQISKEKAKEQDDKFNSRK